MDELSGDRVTAAPGLMTSSARRILTEHEHRHRHCNSHFVLAGERSSAISAGQTLRDSGTMDTTQYHRLEKLYEYKVQIDWRDKHALCQDQECRPFQGEPCKAA